MPAPRVDPDARSAPLRASWLLSLLYVSLFCTLSILKHHNIHSHAFDLGLFQQVVWNTAQGEWFEYTYKVRLEPGLTNYLGDHFDLILAPIAFLYLFCDRPEVLLVLQTCSLAAAGLLIFAVVRRWSGSTVTASLFQILFYLHPAVQGPNLFDFHPLVLAPAFLLLAMLGVETRRFGWFAVGSLLAVLCREQVALVVATLGLYAFVSTRKAGVLAVSCLALVYLGVTVTVLIPIFHPTGVSQHFLAKFGYLGSTPIGALRNVVTSPSMLARIFDDSDRIRYSADMFLCSGVFLPLLSPGPLIVAFSELGVNVLSQGPAQRVVTYQYSATAAAFLVLASAGGAVWIAKRMGGSRSEDRRSPVVQISNSIATAAVMISLLFHFVRYGTVYPLRPDLRATYRSGERTSIAYRFMREIPEGDSVSAQSDLAPHLSNRRNIYVFPVVEEARYVLLDQQGETFPAPLFGVSYPEQVRRMRKDTRYEVILEQAGYVLFRRKQHGGAVSTGGSPAHRR